MKNCIY